MVGSEFSVFSPDAQLQAQASEMGLVVPEIHIANKLQLRLGRRDKLLEVNADALWSGVQDVELENGLQARVDSLPKDTECTTPTCEFQSDTSFLLRISDGAKAERGLEKSVNTAFWLGTLITDQLAEGNRPKYEERARFHASTRNKVLTSAAATNTIIIGTELATTYDAPASIDLPIGGLALVWSYLWLKHIYHNDIKGEDMAMRQIEKEKRDRAAVLGEKYQVLNYADTVTV